ncbi:hypothetical protein CONLIGDRAFT_687561 [Coniochaeta ligniaria NRRL 30616]|uniref:Uncharacterized protein n=1 Tax=Coniochaeta ligniaria NRRL 30616 TaxID=1408157 RepID=A0A1J7I4Q8_9PEZI|nr:hypothetical protein CONLIGDRAFT_687561 [Coniochaeta ligniaria NRRL 30616]
MSLHSWRSWPAAAGRRPPREKILALRSSCGTEAAWDLSNALPPYKEHGSTYDDTDSEAAPPKLAEICDPDTIPVEELDYEAGAAALIYAYGGVRLGDRVCGRCRAKAAEEGSCGIPVPFVACVSAGVVLDGVCCCVSEGASRLEMQLEMIERCDVSSKVSDLVMQRQSKSEVATTWLTWYRLCKMIPPRLS